MIFSHLISLQEMWETGKYDDRIKVKTGYVNAATDNITWEDELAVCVCMCMCVCMCVRACVCARVRVCGACV